jgi:glycosyltransferase involved in cell wall biosynthesis
MKLTIGMASYNNYAETWFSIQALRMYHDLTDTEILVIDNYGDDRLRDFITSWGNGQIRYILDTTKRGTAAAKNKVFEYANGEWVFCIDSHVMLAQGAVARLKNYFTENPQCTDLLQGPLLYDNLISGADSFSDKWSDGMWGQWATVGLQCKRLTLKICKKISCVPFLRWMHLFKVSGAPYPLHIADRIRNYKVGFAELGLDQAVLNAQFGPV